MNLDEIQKQKIADHIKGITAFAETYNELYDHVLSAIGSENHHTFSMDVVANILDEDFGGPSKIKLEEQNHMKELSQSFSGLLRREMLDTFKFPAIAANLIMLAVCYLAYSYGAAEGAKIKVLTATLIISMFIPPLLYFVKVYIIDKGQTKPSIKNPALKSMSLFGMNVATFLTFAFLIPEPLFSLSPVTRYLILLGAYFLLGVYIRAYLKIFNNTLKLKLQ